MWAPRSVRGSLSPARQAGQSTFLNWSSGCWAGRWLGQLWALSYTPAEPGKAEESWTIGRAVGGTSRTSNGNRSENGNTENSCKEEVLGRLAPERVGIKTHPLSPVVRTPLSILRGMTGIVRRRRTQDRAPASSSRTPSPPDRIGQHEPRRQGKPAVVRCV